VSKRKPKLLVTYSPFQSRLLSMVHDVAVDAPVPSAGWHGGGAGLNVGH
jgi:hypothetical protein